MAASRPSKKEYKPRLIFWEVTKGCNLRCIHCRATATELMSPADLPTAKALNIITQIADFANPILVLSGGEPLYRPDIFQLAEYATGRGLRVALATNGTLVTKEVAEKIKHAGIKRVSISLDGSDAATHDSFRGIPGAFDAAIYGMRNLQELGVSVQINMTIARHNAHQLARTCWSWRGPGRRRPAHLPAGARGLRRGHRRRADGCARRVRAHAELVLRSVAEGGIELKATCAPHYFRVVRQRRAADRHGRQRQCRQPAIAHASAAQIGPTEMTMPGSTGISLKPGGGPPQGHTGHPGGHPERHERHDQGLPGGNRRLLPLA